VAVAAVVVQTMMVLQLVLMAVQVVATHLIHQHPFRQELQIKDLEEPVVESKGQDIQQAAVAAQHLLALQVLAVLLLFTAVKVALHTYHQYPVHHCIMLAAVEEELKMLDMVEAVVELVAMADNQT
jgi:hypothetical protein